jgi:hypothetical protein
MLPFRFRSFLVKNGWEELCMTNGKRVTHRVPRFPNNKPTLHQSTCPAERTKAIATSIYSIEEPSNCLVLLLDDFRPANPFPEPGARLLVPYQIGSQVGNL